MCDLPRRFACDDGDYDDDDGDKGSDDKNRFEDWTQTDETNVSVTHDIKRLSYWHKLICREPVHPHQATMFLLTLAGWTAQVPETAKAIHDEITLSKKIMAKHNEN